MDFGYIYKTINLDNGKIYIGKKSGRFDPSYFGSGLIIKRSIKRRISRLEVKLIAYLPNAEQLNEFEIFMIKKYREVLGTENMYNISDGGDGCSINKGQKRPHANGCKCPFCKAKRGELKGAACSTFGKKSDHASSCNCCICKAKRKELVGINNPNYGRHLSEKARNSIRLSRLGKPLNHLIHCPCGVCKSKRGEYRKETHPSWKGKKINDYS